MLKSTCLKFSLISIGICGTSSYLLYKSKLDKLLNDYRKQIRFFNHFSLLEKWDIKPYFSKDDKFVNKINFSNCSPYFTRYFSTVYRLDITESIYTKNLPKPKYRENYIGYRSKFTKMPVCEYKNRIIYNDYSGIHNDLNEDEKKMLSHFDDIIKKNALVFLYIHKDDIDIFNMIKSDNISLHDLTKHKIRFFIEYKYEKRPKICFPILR